MKNNYNDYTDEQKELKKTKDSKILKFVSLFLALLPMALILFCIIASKGEDESGAGAVMWLIVFYYWSIGIPVAIGSVVTGVISFMKRRNILSIISMILAILPFVLFAFYVL